jgi:hypothetical protein
MAALRYAPSSPLISCSFNRSNRPPESPQSFTYGLWNEERSRGTREICKSVLSGGNDVCERGWVKGRPPIGVVGDIYTQFVTRGSINPIISYLTALGKGSTSNMVTASVRPHEERSTECRIENVVAVIDTKVLTPCLHYQSSLMM